MHSWCCCDLASSSSSYEEEKRLRKYLHTEELQKWKHPHTSSCGSCCTRSLSDVRSPCLRVTRTSPIRACRVRQSTTTGPEATSATAFTAWLPERGQYQSKHYLVNIKKLNFQIFQCYRSLILNEDARIFKRWGLKEPSASLWLFCVNKKLKRHHSTVLQCSGGSAKFWNANVLCFITTFLSNCSGQIALFTSCGILVIVLRFLKKLFRIVLSIFNLIYFLVDVYVKVLGDPVYT